MKKVFLIGMALMAAVACKKTTTPTPEVDNEAPMVTVISPKEGQTYTLGTPMTVRLLGTATENDDLHEMMLTVKGSDSATIFSWAPYVHELQSFIFDTTVKVGSATVKDYTLHIEAADHHDNVFKKDYHFHTQP